MKNWPQEAYKWYREACDMFDYPSGPYGKPIKALIAEGDTVMDLGCGIGAASIMIAPWCRRVIALDQDENALRCLTDRARETGITNIEIIHERWPVLAPLQVDVIIALHVAQAMNSLANIKNVFESAAKGGFIACQAPVSRQDEPFCELKEELGITPSYEKCDNGCHIKGMLDALGARVSCEKHVYEFGQPLNTPEEAARFICWQIGAEDSMIPTVNKRIEHYTVKTNGKYLVPIRRQSCGITFVK